MGTDSLTHLLILTLRTYLTYLPELPTDENVRNLRFCNFSYCLDPDKTSQKYSITKSWNNLPFDLKSTQPDDFLEELRKYFNYSNDQTCQNVNCWLCEH